MRFEQDQPFPWMPIIFVTVIFYLNFTSRVILAPLLPVIEEDLGIGHGEAGSLFLYIACGSGVGLLGSGFVSSRVKGSPFSLLIRRRPFPILRNRRLSRRPRKARSV